MFVIGVYCFGTLLYELKTGGIEKFGEGVYYFLGGFGGFLAMLPLIERFTTWFDNLD